MKDNLYILFLSSLLLMAVSYEQIFHKLSYEKSFQVGFAHDLNTDAEEGSEKSTEENTREADQDEDAIKIVDMIASHSANFLTCSKNENYSFGLLAHYPEIVSPPPQS